VETLENRDSDLKQIDHCDVTEDRLTVNKAWFYHITVQDIKRKCNEGQNGGNPVFAKEHAGLALELIHYHIGSLKEKYTGLLRRLWAGVNVTDSLG